MLSLLPDVVVLTTVRTVPAKWVPEFRNNHSFPADIVKNANKELDNFAAILETFGVKVTRPRVVDWSNPETPGYTGSMVSTRDLCMK